MRLNRSIRGRHAQIDAVTVIVTTGSVGIQLAVVVANLAGEVCVEAIGEIYPDIKESFAEAIIKAAKKLRILPLPRHPAGQPRREPMVNGRENNRGFFVRSDAAGCCV